MLDTSREAQDKIRQLTESVDNFAAAKKELEPKGMTVVEANVEDFRKVAQEKIWPAYKPQYGGLWEQIAELQGLGRTVARFIAAIPKIVVALLLVAAIVNLLIGVFLRYVMIEVTDWLDVDPIRFTWVEEVGEMLLAWLTLIGAAIGVRERTPLHPARAALRAGAPGRSVDRIHHVLIAVIGALAAWYGVKLCLLNRTLVTPGLEINLAAALRLGGGRRRAAGGLRHLDDRGAAAARSDIVPLEVRPNDPASSSRRSSSS